jgi:hypothetical protein
MRLANPPDDDQLGRDGAHRVYAEASSVDSDNGTAEAVSCRPSRCS